jgi:hypothetical protein
MSKKLLTPTIARKFGMTTNRDLSVEGDALPAVRRKHGVIFRLPSLDGLGSFQFIFYSNC